MLTSLDVKLRGAGPPLEDNASILLRQAAIVGQVHRREVPVCVYEQLMRACTTHKQSLGRLGALAKCDQLCVFFTAAVCVQSGCDLPVPCSLDGHIFK
jgi:hypothetical protein